ncbi:MAG: acyl-CoA/acyl-ACP dehydrogenase [Solirubrobacterales bacterium]|nr:acyl-CoA/acyl-ACP dehydrogenase [Solirubrobacterales bacterium]
MGIAFTPEQIAFRDAIDEFAARECGTLEQRHILTAEGTEPTNMDIMRKLGGLGWTGVSIEEEYGGAGGNMVDQTIFLEGISRGMIPAAGFGTTAIVQGAYQRHGTEEQKKNILGGICEGNVEAIVMSEPGSGSDVGSLQCRAEKVDGGYVINGQKTWCSNAQVSANILTIVRTDSSGSKHEGITMLGIPAGTEGMEIRPIPTLAGPHEVNDIFLTDCFVPDEALLGEEGGGWMQLMTGLNSERMILSAMYLGIAQRAFDDTLKYVKEREQFGRPIGSFQALKHRIADMATELECLRLLIYDIAQQIDEDPNRVFAKEASMAKLKSTEVAKYISLEGMQMMGGYGYALEYDMEKHVRAGLVGTIFAGTSEIQREIIGATLGL